MPSGVPSKSIREAVEEALVVTDGDEMHTVRPLWQLPMRARVRLAELFRDQRVEVEVWPNRVKDDPANYTARKCRVLSSSYNAQWGNNGTAVLVLEFELQTNRWDLPLLMHWIHAIRTAPPATDDETAEEVTYTHDHA